VRPSEEECETVPNHQRRSVEDQRGYLDRRTVVSKRGGFAWLA
jgi:hypothetical protein